MFRLRSLRVEKFRDLRGGAELTFGHGVHLVLGRNASGKTNLLKLIAMIGRGDFSPLAGEEFAFEWEMEGEVGETPVPAVMRGRLEQGAPPAELLADPRFAMAGALPRPFEASFQLESPGLQLRVTGTSRDGWSVSVNGEEPRAVGGSVELFGESVVLAVAAQLFGGRAGEVDHMMRLVTFGASCPGRLDEGLMYFLALLGEGSGASEVIPIVPSLRAFSLGEPGWLLVASEPFPHGFRSGELGDPGTVVAAAAEGATGWVAEALGAEAITFSARESERAQSPSGRPMVSYRGLDLRITFGNRTISDPALLSYGQRRLIAFFWYAASSPKGILVADELGNGLHHSWLRACFEEIGERQAFIAAQDPLVFDHVEFADAADMRARVIVCTPTPPDQPGGRGWSWRQPDQGEAAEFMAAYDVGIQKVSELLRAHGLW